MRPSPSPALLLTALQVLLLTGSPIAAQDGPRDEGAGVPSPALRFVSVQTERGEILLELDSAAAPVTVTNFLRYLDAGLLDGGSFYRAVRMDNQPDDSVKIEVIQGGMNRARRREAFPPIPLEGTATTGLTHSDGTISMARSGPSSARAEFFIVLGAQPELDAGGARNPDGLGFAAFGRVVRGMEVVHEIQRGETEGQSLVDPVSILTARRVPGR